MVDLIALQDYMTHRDGRFVKHAVSVTDLIAAHDQPDRDTQDAHIVPLEDATLPRQECAPGEATRQRKSVVMCMVIVALLFFSGVVLYVATLRAQ